MKSRRARWMMLMVAVLKTAPVYAHNLDDRYGPFVGNFLHPLTSLDHGLAFLAVGLLAGQQARESTWTTIGSFLTGLIIGTSLPLLLLLADGSVAQLTTVNIASLLVVGGLVALACPLPVSLLMILGALIGLSHGFENSIDMEPESRGLLSTTGIVVAGLFASVLFAAIAASVRAAWLRVGVRIMGSWIFAIGLMMLGFQLRGP